ncbi:carboxylesterase family protein [Kribbella deserti]|uniref:Carboxylesterase family protein n=1 Tax=Kribbella deserti TaxID=1926257 RepID=A0ABV6QPH0_9ACTN
MPVMVWIHGDGSIGSGAQFDPARLVANGDVVVVTINFRLGVFGTFAHPDLKDSGTIGLQDQRAALQWVQRNAAAFGGDPGNVTLFGVSFGATATSAHLMSKDSHGLFHRAIMQSGFTLMDMPAGVTYPQAPALPWYGWTTTKDAQAQGLAVAKQLGCKNLACLRKVPVKKLLAIPQVMNIFQPYALGNDQLPSDPVKALADGDFAKVPILTGITRDEHTTFVASSVSLRGVRQLTKAQVDLSNQMIAYWTNFARGGDPNGESLPSWRKFAEPTDVQALRPAPGQSGPVDFAADLLAGPKVGPCLSC